MFSIIVIIQCAASLVNIIRLWYFTPFLRKVTFVVPGCTWCNNTYIDWRLKSVFFVESVVVGEGTTMFCSLTLKVYIVLFRVVWKGESYIFFPYDMFNKEAKTGNKSFENEYMVMSFVFIGVWWTLDHVIDTIVPIETKS